MATYMRMMMPLGSAKVQCVRSSPLPSLPLPLYSSSCLPFLQTLALLRIRHFSQAVPNALASLSLSCATPLVFHQLRSCTGERHMCIGDFSCAARRKKKLHSSGDEDGEDSAIEAALEALFSQLENDLEKGESSPEGNSDTITDEELVRFEQDLDIALDMEDGKDLSSAPVSKQLVKEIAREAAFGISPKFDLLVNENLIGSQRDSKKISRRSRKTDISRQLDIENDAGRIGRSSKKKREAAVSVAPPLNNTADIVESLEDNALEDEESEFGERIIKLEKWQLKKLASAAETGRRRVNIKSLAAELGLDRSDVLSFLREPPPELLMAVFDEEKENLEATASETLSNMPKHIVNVATMASDKKIKGPQGNRPRNWYSEKRLGKEVLTTLERVYRRTHRPTDSLIQNIVELTHVPRRRILEWFEVRRGEKTDQNESLDKLSG